MSKGIKILYCCGVDWQHEICEAPDLEGSMPLYSSVEELKNDRTCWKSCGIVKLEAKLLDWVEPQKLFASEESKNE